MGVDPVAVREEWEARQRLLVAENEAQRRREVARRELVEEKGDRLRVELSAKLVSLIESLDPYVDSTMGEPSAAMVAVYVRAVHELGALYQLQRPPRTPVLLLPVPEPEPVVSEAVRGAVAAEAVAVLRGRVLLQLEEARGALAVARGGFV